jgi:outer membrane protein
MNTKLALAAVPLLLLVASFSTSAQIRPAATATPTPRPVASQPVASANVVVPATKIAFVDTGMFADDKAGIRRYVNAVKSIQREFEPRNLEFTNLQTRIKTLADEISRLSGAAVVDPKTIQAKQEEGERLQRELKYKKEQADADVGKRYKELVGPVSADIGRALDQYASRNGLTMILDISKLLPAVLTMNPSMDITNAFIADFNSRNP